MKKILVVAVFALGGMYFINQAKSAVSYVDVECPECGCTEVLDYGTDDAGNQECHCYDCKCDFTIEK